VKNTGVNEFALVVIENIFAAGHGIIALDNLLARSSVLAEAFPSTIA
jgi:hypothetical protein